MIEAQSLIATLPPAMRKRIVLGREGRDWTAAYDHQGVKWKVQAPYCSDAIRALVAVLREFNAHA